MPTTESAFQTVFAWARKPRPRSSPDINASFSRRDLDAIYTAGQLERLIDLGVGIKRQEEIPHQKIERCARNRQTADFDPQQMYRSLAMGGPNAGPNRHQLFPFNQFGDQPVGFQAAGMPD